MILTGCMSLGELTAILEHAYLAWVERAKYVHLSLSHLFSLFRRHSPLVSEFNTIVGLLPTVYRDTRVLSRALAVLGSLQLGSRVCVRVSKDLWYLSLFINFLIVHMRVLTLKTQTAANIKIPGYLEYSYY